MAKPLPLIAWGYLPSLDNTKKLFIIAMSEEGKTISTFSHQLYHVLNVVESDLLINVLITL